MRASDTARMVFAQRCLAAAAAVDYILDVWELPDYVEIVTRSGAGMEGFPSECCAQGSRKLRIFNMRVVHSLFEKKILIPL